YEGMAEEMMEKLADGLKERYEIHEVAIHHRVGRVEIGEPSVVIAVSAAHRRDALAACRDAIDILKVDVPLWKKEVYEGGEEWVGCGSAPPPITEPTSRSNRAAPTGAGSSADSQRR